MTFIEALNMLLAEQLFKVQGAHELNDPKKVLSTSVKHLYGLIDRLHDMKTRMIGMSPKDAIEPKEVCSSMRIILQKRHCMRMDCISTSCSPVKGMMTGTKEPWIEYGARLLTD